METPELKAEKIVYDYYALISSQFIKKNLCEVFAKELSHRCVYEVKKSIPLYIGGRVVFDNPDVKFWEAVDDLIDSVKMP